ncbi:MAG: GC-type dockerin domain-anchored protein [Phycisphaerales bacterium]
MGSSKPILPSLACLLACSGSTLAQCDAERLVRAPEETGSFGLQVHVDDRWLIVGDWTAYTACSTPDPFACSGGATFVYEREGDQWVFLQKIVPGDIAAFDQFGSFAIDGDRMLIPTPRKFSDPRLGRVDVYDYVESAGQWVETDRFYPPDTPEADAAFAAPIALGGSLALAVQGDLIHRYVQGAEGWEYRESFGAPDGLPSDANFGQQVEIDGDWVFVAAPLDSTHDDRHGSVYVYRRNADDSLTFTQKLLPPGDSISLAYYGLWIASSEGEVAIAAPGQSRTFSGQGAVFTYELVGGQWTLSQELACSDSATSGVFGAGLAFHADTLVAGTWRNWDFTSYVFQRGGNGQWREVAKLTPDDATPEGWFADGFGQRAATDGRHVVYGVPGERTTRSPVIRTGAVYAFDLDCEICEADLDADGALTIFDFLMFANLFDAGDPQADFDGDGELTIFDFLAFQTAFDAGCA